MILPTKTIAPDRALLSLAAFVLNELSHPHTVSRLWDTVRNHNRQRPLAYSWFILSLDLLFLMNLVWLDQNGLLRRVRSRD